MKDKYLKFIKDFSKINISSICAKLEINRENVLKGKASEQTTKKLYDEINNQLSKISHLD